MAGRPNEMSNSFEGGRSIRLDKSPTGTMLYERAEVKGREETRA